jgi:DNA-binding NarL/FixJ family response regulator
MQVTGVASKGEELLQHLDESNPEIVVQDLLIPGGLDGIETRAHIAGAPGYPGDRIDSEHR